jgi:hypothetical protein
MRLKDIPMDEFLQQLITRRENGVRRRSTLFDERGELLTAARAAGHEQLSDDAQARYDSLSQSIEGTDQELKALPIAL